MNGDFDWEELRQVGRQDAAMWFVPFTIIVVMLLLNMMMAIIMDTYSEVKDSLENADTLWTEGRKVWRRWRAARRHEIIELPVVKQHLEYKLAEPDEREM